MWPNPQFPADLVTFTEEILNGKLPFLCSAHSQPKVELTLMKNLGQVRSFLTWLLYPSNSLGFRSVSWEQPYFYWFQGRNLLGNDQNFNRDGDVKKRENQMPREKSLFINQNSCHISFLLHLLHLDLDSRRKYFLNNDSLIFLVFVCEHIIYFL